MHRVRILLAALLLPLACSSAHDGGDARVAALRDASQTGTLESARLVEASGLTASLRTGGVFWSNNDSGNEPVIHAIDSTGRSLAAVRVTGATNRDWEALSSGPCPAGSCLYIGDVGDNNRRRSSVSVWRIPEPALEGASRASRASAAAESAPAERLTLRYPDGSHDVEAMWVSADTSIWLVTKRPLENREGVYRPALLFRVRAAAWSARGTEPVRAELVDSLPFVPGNRDSDGWITDAALSGPSVTGGRRLAIRTYRDLAVFEADGVTGRPGALVARCSLRALRQRSGESVAWLPSGALLLAHEGLHSPVWAGHCP